MFVYLSVSCESLSVYIYVQVQSAVKICLYICMDPVSIECVCIFVQIQSVVNAFVYLYRSS